MENTINVILDFSGSMTELGKSAVLKSMVFRLRTLADRGDAKARFFLWQEELFPFRGKWDVDLTGSTNLKALQDFIASRSGEKYLLLSDGISDTTSIEVIRACLAESHSLLLSVAIGRDADYQSLREISYDKNVWHAADVMQVMDYLCHGTDEVKSL